MARCEDFPCCGHEPGCCPDFDPETGRQMNMKCTCGATVPLTSKYSLCEGCMGGGRRNPDAYDGVDTDDECDECGCLLKVDANGVVFCRSCSLEALREYEMDRDLYGDDY